MTFPAESLELPLQNSRTERRFPVTLDLRYTTSGRYPLTGTGRTIEAGSSRLRFTGDTPLLAGQNIQVYIDWPAVLEGGVKLQLVIWGEVVGTDRTEVALRILKHDFRTRREGQLAPKESVGA